MAPCKKNRLSVYLDPDVMNALADYAAARDVSQSLIAEAAIASFLSPDAAERKEAAITRRLDQLDRRVQRLERDVGIATETLALFVRFWLTTTPALPESRPRPRHAPKACSATTASSRRSAAGCAKGRSSGRRSPRTCRRHRQPSGRFGRETVIAGDRTNRRTASR